MSLMLCVCFLHLNAQFWEEDIPKPKKNSIYLEGGGIGIAYSINYDHLFSMKNNPKVGIATRIGYSQGEYPWIFGLSDIKAILPMEIFFSYGTKSCLELGLSYTIIIEEHGSERGDAVNFRSSYRYRGPKGFNFGVGVIARMDQYGILFPLPHMSIGFSF